MGPNAIEAEVRTLLSLDESYGVVYTDSKIADENGSLISDWTFF